MCNRAREISLVHFIATCIGKLKLIIKQNLKNYDFFRASSKANSQVKVSFVLHTIPHLSLLSDINFLELTYSIEIGISEPESVARVPNL